MQRWIKSPRGRNVTRGHYSILLSTGSLRAEEKCIIQNPMKNWEKQVLSNQPPRRCSQSSGSWEQCTLPRPRLGCRTASPPPPRLQAGLAPLPGGLPRTQEATRGSRGEPVSRRQWVQILAPAVPGHPFLAPKPPTAAGYCGQ